MSDKIKKNTKTNLPRVLIQFRTGQAGDTLIRVVETVRGGYRTEVFTKDAMGVAAWSARDGLDISSVLYALSNNSVDCLLGFTKAGK